MSKPIPPQNLSQHRKICKNKIKEFLKNNPITHFENGTYKIIKSKLKHPFKKILKKTAKNQ
ncbi:hypothetical protein ACFL2K_03785 [Candidatus Margulisiibacteriota bacterium]